MLVPSEQSHADYIAKHMRVMDVLECEAMGHSPIEALNIGLRQSLWSLTGFSDGQPAAMLGVFPFSMITGIGVPWMLGTDAVYDNARAFVRYGPGVIRHMEGDFATLRNVVSAENDKAIGLLRHFGWKVESERFDIGGVDFVRFSNV